MCPTKMVAARMVGKLFDSFKIRRTVAAMVTYKSSQRMDLAILMAKGSAFRL